MSKTKVYENYNKISEWFDAQRNKSLIEIKYLNLITDSIPTNGSILDLGCGTGEPIAKFFIEKNYKVTGIDGSHKMIELCQKRFPTARWIEIDMRRLNLNEKFDAILAWHSFFHLPHEDQRKMFSKFASHVNPNGILAFTSGTQSEEAWSNNGGEDLYHASLSINEYEMLLIKHDFKMLLHKVADANCGNATVWIAKKLE